MNNLLKTLMLLAVASMFFSSCKTDDPEPVNEEELITTVKLTFTGGGEINTIQSVDLDGDGPNAPVITPATLSLSPNVTYAVSVEFLNEAENPAEDITEEVAEEGEEHQVFYILNNSNVFSSFAYAGGADNDADDKPIGLNVNATTSATGGTSTLRVVLRHELNKATAGLSIGNFQPNTAGGNTDIDVTFNVSIAN